MKPLLENKQVERILSLIVIMYGLRLTIPSAKSVILGDPYNFFHWYFIWCYLISMLAGCLLIIFFPHVVQWIGYFATGGKARSRRRWLSKEILAIPLVLYVFTEFLYVFFNVAFITPVLLMSLFYDPSFLRVRVDASCLLIVPFCFVYFGFAVIVLFSARYIAVWLLRVR